MTEEHNIGPAHRKCIIERETSQAGLRKIRIRIPPEDGWTDVEAEWVWGEPVGPAEFAIRNFPIYAYGLSFDDVVRVKAAEDGTLEFVEVINRGGHSTYRTIAKKPVDEEEMSKLVARLKLLGCDTESANPIHLTIDVPSETDVHEVYRLLEEAEQAGFLEFEEGHCGHPV